MNPGTICIPLMPLRATSCWAGRCWVPNRQASAYSYRLHRCYPAQPNPAFWASTPMAESTSSSGRERSQVRRRNRAFWRKRCSQVARDLSTIPVCASSHYLIHRSPDPPTRRPHGTCWRMRRVCRFSAPQPRRVFKTQIYVADNDSHDLIS